MSNNNAAGVYQLPSGKWAYRFTKTVDGKRINRKNSKDEFGNPLKTKNEAIRARQVAELKLEASLHEKPKHRITVQEVFEEYCEQGRSGKAYATIKKQDSLWRNHISVNFGARFIDDISVAEVNDYLAKLYYDEGRSYMYVEGFLKMFYFSRNHFLIVG